MRSLFSFLLLCCSLLASSQAVIRGRVVNESGGNPVPGSSVFISNTSRGTTSDASGNFELRDIPPGKHDLVISSVGYETNVFSFSSEELPLQLKIELKIKVKELANVTAENSVEEGWDKWGRTFTEYFIGMTSNASKCRIKNQEVIKFRYYKKTNRLVAYSDEPILIENKALGYVVKYQLEDFQVNFSERSLFFMGYSLFEQLDENSRKKWTDNRKEAFNGSIMHFMRSLYTGRVQEEGFSVRRLYRMMNEEKARVRNLYNSSRATGKNANGLVLVKSFTEWANGFSKDSARYYQSLRLCTNPVPAAQGRTATLTGNIA